MSSHHFISYSSVDARDFALKLMRALESGLSPLRAWVDQRDLKPAVPWDEQLAEASAQYKDNAEATMAYDEALAQRIRAALPDVTGLTEKKIFGGIGFLIHGNMACGVNGNDLMVRISPDSNEAAIAKPHVRVFDMTGRPMKGWILVDSAGIQSAEDLQSWLRQGVAFAQSLPAK
jgi:TfoX/Sxy family transcriptional regulator of competence genes